MQTDAIEYLKKRRKKSAKAKPTKGVIDKALHEWRSKKRRMDCVAATDWFCARVPGFTPLRITRYTKEGDTFQHVVATDGLVVIDISPYADKPADDAGQPAPRCNSPGMLGEGIIAFEPNLRMIRGEKQ